MRTARDGKRGPRWPLRVEAGLLVTLGVILVLRAGGVARQHLLPVAEHLALAAAMLAAFLASLRIERRYARRLAGTGVPMGVRLTRPLWMDAWIVVLMLAMGGIAGAAFSAVGLPGVAAGALLAFGLMAVAFPFFLAGLWTRGLTFESSGLHIHAWRVSFFVPWTSVVSVEEVGPDHMQIVVLEVAAPGQIVARAEPGARARVERFVGAPSAPAGRLMLWPGTAGLDGSTIARAVRVAKSGGRSGGGQVN
jgi:hypothetical protein